MKHLFFTALSLISLASYAQDTAVSGKTPNSPSVTTPDPIVSSAAVMTMNTDDQGLVVVLIPEATSKEVQKDWVKYTGAGSKGKATVVNGEYLQSSAVNKNISSDPFDLSASMLESSEGVRLSVHIVQNLDKPLTPAQSADRSIALQKYVHDFAVMEYKGIVQDQLKSAQSKQKDMEKELAHLYKEEEKANKHINDDQRSIQKANDQIASNKADIQSTNAKIEAQKGMVASTAGDANASKGANKTLNDLEHDRKELQRKNNSLSKDIDSYNNDISTQQRAITGYKEKEAAQTTAINGQKQAVQSVQTKLNGIK